MYHVYDIVPNLGGGSPIGTTVEIWQPDDEDQVDGLLEAMGELMSRPGLPNPT